VTDPINNQARAFGFCTYENAEGVLRALRLLNDFEIDGKKLLVKVDDNTQQYLDGYEKQKKLLEDKTKAVLAEARENGETPHEISAEDLDQQVRNKINTLVAERTTGEFFEKYFQDGEERVVIPVAEGEVVAGHEIDKQKAVVVAQEIKNFRVRQAARDKEKNERGDEDKPERMSDRDYEREQREKERERARVREQRSRDREREARRRDREKREFREREREWISREKEKERERERREREDERERERQLERELNYDEEEDKAMRQAGRRKRVRERELLEDEEDRKAELEAERLLQEREMEVIRQQQEEEERRRQEEEERRQGMCCFFFCYFVLFICVSYLFFFFLFIFSLIFLVLFCTIFPRFFLVLIRIANYYRGGIQKTTTNEDRHVYRVRRRGSHHEHPGRILHRSKDQQCQEAWIQLCCRCQAATSDHPRICS